MEVLHVLLPLLLLLSRSACDAHSSGAGGVLEARGAEGPACSVGGPAGSCSVLHEGKRTQSCMDACMVLHGEWLCGGLLCTGSSGRLLPPPLG